MTAETWDRVHVIGVDDSGPNGLGRIERELIEAADLLCGGRRHLDLFPDGSAERLTIAGDLAPIYDRLCEAPGHRRAVVIASGDPCFFGIGPLLAEKIGRDRILIHPRAGSISMAFSRLGIAWQDATALSVHGRPIEDAIPAALGSSKLAILTDPKHTPSAVAEALLRAGMDDCPAYVCERLDGPAERIHRLTLAAIPGRDFDPLNVLVVLPSRTAPAGPVFGRPDSEYRQVRGQITKAEVRAVTLSRLEPWRASLAWDVGAGAGSVAIEMAGLMSGGSVMAVERDPEQLGALRDNIRGLGAASVSVIAGSAPEAIASLPDPDAIFIGGGGNRLDEIIRVCAGRLRPGGRLVANFARLESLATWQRIAAELGWQQDIAEVSVARGTRLGDGTRLAPLGPVFVTRLMRREERI